MSVDVRVLLSVRFMVVLVAEDFLLPASVGIETGVIEQRKILRVVFVGRWTEKESG